MIVRHAVRRARVSCRSIQTRSIHASARLLIEETKEKKEEEEKKNNTTTTSNLFGEEFGTKSGQIKHRTQYNPDPFSLKPSSDHYEYPLVNQEWLAKQTKRPKSVRMLARDFIHDSLYNPAYGYFSRHAVLLPDGQKHQRAYDFPALANERAFMVAVEERYSEFENSIQAQDEKAAKETRDRVDSKVKEVLSPLLKKNKNKNKEADQATPTSTKSKTRVVPLPGSAQALDAAQRKGRIDLARQLLNEKETDDHDRDVKAMAARQVWHTPTELFKPHFAHAIARYIIQEKVEGKPLCVYEVGAGSGALASDILDFIQAQHPDLYKDMSYHIIEISPRLANQQRSTIAKHITNAPNRIKVINKSILDWQEQEKKDCFFLAMEVFDNLTHDVVRYATDTLLPYQAIVSIDATGDMHELWEPVQDKNIQRYLSMQRSQSSTSNFIPPTAPNWMRFTPNFFRGILTRNIPFYPNLTEPEYIPTGSLQLLDVLSQKFPKHRMVMADFDALPDSLVGLNAPVVQTRLNGTMIAVTKYTVHQGFFDIFFPTNFKDLKRTHDQVMKSAGRSNEKQILSHRQFLQTYADLPETTCKDGSNPMLSWYANASWFLS
jgi:Putative S-adenosyl-L-methionine-dependent methyltransferase